MTKENHLFPNVMGLGYNKNVLYPRPITLAKRFYRCHAPCLIKLIRFFIYIYYYKCTKLQFILVVPSESDRSKTAKVVKGDIN